MEFDRENQIALLVGAGLGAALMFILDPGRGARRRALVRDKTGKLLRHSGRAIRDRSEDIRNRISGTAAEIRAKDSTPPTDHQLEERVRAVAAHPVAVRWVSGLLLVAFGLAAGLLGGLLAVRRGNLAG